MICESVWFRSATVATFGIAEHRIGVGVLHWLGIGGACKCVGWNTAFVVSIIKMLLKINHASGTVALTFPHKSWFVHKLQNNNYLECKLCFFLFLGLSSTVFCMFRMLLLWIWCVCWNGNHNCNFSNIFEGISTGDLSLMNIWTTLMNIRRDGKKISLWQRPWKKSVDSDVRAFTNNNN